MNVLSGRWIAILGLFLWTAHAQALVQEMTAEFRPDPSNPMINRFKNTTPESGICPWHIPERCKQLGIFSIRTTEIQFHSTAQSWAITQTRAKARCSRCPPNGVSCW